jgi:hypothetical protein
MWDDATDIGRGGPMRTLLLEALAVVGLSHADRFRFLDPHFESGRTVLRVVMPDADSVTTVCDNGRDIPLEPIHLSGLCQRERPDSLIRNRLRVRLGNAVVNRDDLYRFPRARKVRCERGACIVVVGFMLRIHFAYDIRVPFAEAWSEVLSTDALRDGGRGSGNSGVVTSVEGQDGYRLTIVVPPLATIFLVQEH